MWIIANWFAKFKCNIASHQSTNLCVGDAVLRFVGSTGGGCGNASTHAITDTDADADTDTNTNTDTYTDTDTNVEEKVQAQRPQALQPFQT